MTSLLFRVFCLSLGLLPIVNSLENIRFIESSRSYLLKVFSWALHWLSHFSIRFFIAILWFCSHRMRDEISDDGLWIFLHDFLFIWTQMLRILFLLSRIFKSLDYIFSFRFWIISLAFLGLPGTATDWVFFNESIYQVTKFIIFYSLFRGLLHPLFLIRIRFLHFACILPTTHLRIIHLWHISERHILANLRALINSRNWINEITVKHSIGVFFLKYLTQISHSCLRLLLSLPFQLIKESLFLINSDLLPLDILEHVPGLFKNYIIWKDLGELFVKFVDLAKSRAALILTIISF